MCPSRLWVSAGLTPAIGSSSMISLGSAISARAISNSLRWPPDSEPANSPRMWSSRKRSRSSSARASLAFSSERQNTGSRLDQKRSPIWAWAPSFMFSMTESRLRLLVSWNVRTMPARASL